MDPWRRKFQSFLKMRKDYYKNWKKLSPKEIEEFKIIRDNQTKIKSLIDKNSTNTNKKQKKAKVEEHL